MHINLRGVDLVYDDAGQGSAILFLHGYPFNRSMWREQIDFLSMRDYRCIAPDLRGLGQSVAPTSAGESGKVDHSLKSVPPATMEDMARDCAALMDQLKIERAIICGLSMGCYVALEFVRLFPRRVRGLVLAGGRAQGANDTEKHAREQQAQRALAEGMNFAVESISTNLLAQKTFDDKPQVVAQVREMILQTDPRGAASAQRAMALRRDYSRDLPNIDVPTLIVAGRQDGVRNPEDAEFLHHGIPNSRLEVIEDAGHLMNMEQPEIFNRSLMQVLSEVGDSRHKISTGSASDRVD